MSNTVLPVIYGHAGMEYSNKNMEYSIAVVAPSASISIQLDDETSALYELVAEIHHSGSMQSGHYSVKSLDRTSGKWFLCNDLAISETQLAPSKSSYVLFYVLKNLNLS